MHGARCVMSPPDMAYMSWEFRYMSYKLSKFSWGLSHGSIMTTFIYGGLHRQNNSSRSNARPPREQEEVANI
jgi:hypothetical protein